MKTCVSEVEDQDSSFLLRPPLPLSLVPSCSEVYEPEIGDMDEGVVEAGEDAGNCDGGVSSNSLNSQFLRDAGNIPPNTSSPSLTWGPRLMFSAAGRWVFLGAIVTVVVDLPDV